MTASPGTSTLYVPEGKDQFARKSLVGNRKDLQQASPLLESKITFYNNVERYDREPDVAEVSDDENYL